MMSSFTRRGRREAPHRHRMLGWQSWLQWGLWFCLRGTGGGGAWYRRRRCGAGAMAADEVQELVVAEVLLVVVAIVCWEELPFLNFI